MIKPNPTQSEDGNRAERREEDGKEKEKGKKLEKQERGKVRDLMGGGERKKGKWG